LYGQTDKRQYTDPGPLDREVLTADEALLTRRSVRAFLPAPVDRSVVEELLTLASRSPSGSNIQPWKVHVVAGEARERLSRAILEALDRDGYEGHKREWNYYPVNWREPYLARRRKIGWDLYGLLGIKKGDFEGTERQRRRNYEFFGAPVGLIFTLDQDLEIGSWLDLLYYTLRLAADRFELVQLHRAARRFLGHQHDQCRHRRRVPPAREPHRRGESGQAGCRSCHEYHHDRRRGYFRHRRPSRSRFRAAH